MANDGLLYSGQTSVSKRLDKLERQALIKNKKKNALLPSEEVILELIENEQKETKLRLIKLVNPTTKDEELKSLIIALNLYDDSLKSLKLRVRNILRHSIKDKEVTNE